MVLDGTKLSCLISRYLDKSLRRPNWKFLERGSSWVEGIEESSFLNTLNWDYRPHFKSKIGWFRLIFELRTPEASGDPALCSSGWGESEEWVLLRDGCFLGLPLLFSDLGLMMSPGAWVRWQVPFRHVFVWYEWRGRHSWSNFWNRGKWRPFLCQE